MNIEQEVFKRVFFDFKKLETYGFRKEGAEYRYSKIFMDIFRADIIIDENQVITGKIYDLSFGEEYTNFRRGDLLGEFANKVKEQYISILNDIAIKCSEKWNFIT